MAVSQSNEVSVAAGATVNVLATERIANIDKRFVRALVSIVCNQSATGLLVSAFVGSDNPMFPSAPNIEATQKPIPQFDTLGSFLVEGGDILNVTVNNPTAGALIFRWFVIVENA